MKYKLLGFNGHVHIVVFIPKVCQKSRKFENG